MSGSDSQVSTRSVMFTDLVGSTELRVRLGDEAAEAVRRRHDSLLNDVITTHRGALVKGLGDGVMASFEAAADAVAAAIGIQQAVDLWNREAADLTIGIRIGLSVGDVTIEADDIFGVTAVEASRLCAAAGGGQILAADLVRALSRGRGGYTFEPMGALELKGLAEPLLSSSVLWQPLADKQAGGVELPLHPVLTQPGASSYVGRRALLAKLEALRDEASQGGCKAALLAGEPGIGKTRTAAELAVAAHAAGMTVLFGRCDEDLAVPYQPFVEALRWYVEHGADLPVGRQPEDLANLAPDLATQLRVVPASAGSDPQTEEFRRFEAVRSWLVTASQSHGLVLVLDDLHWASKPTLLLLAHVLKSAADDPGSRLLIIGTYRDTDIDRSHPLSAVLAELRRLPAVERFGVDGLDESELVAYLETAAGHELDQAGHALAITLREETEGNPFFVGEVVRHLIETGAIRREADRWVRVDSTELAIPEGVRDVVGRRLSLLSPVANQILAAAAVIGRAVDLDVLAAVTELSEDDVLDALDEALRARLVEEVGVDRFRFAHALVRATLYEELSATRRRRAHRQVVGVLEHLHSDDVVTLAYHAVAAGPNGDALSTAVGYVIGAAKLAQEARAPAEAEARFRQAIELLDDNDYPDALRQWLPAMRGVGECQRDQGNAAYRETLMDVARQAYAAGEADELVAAVLANHRGLPSLVGTVDHERLELIEHALAAIPDDRNDTRARLLALMATELTFDPDVDRRLRICDEAEAMARTIGDRSLLAWVLVQTGFSAQAIDRWERLLNRTADALALADETEDPALRVMARVWRSNALVTAGRMAECHERSAEGRAIAEADGSPRLQWIATAFCVRILLDRGQFDEAATLNDTALMMAEACGEPDGVQWWQGLVAGLLIQRGGRIDLVDASREFADAHVNASAWRLSEAWALAKAGRTDEAGALLREYGFDVDIDGPMSEALPLWPALQLAGLAWELSDRTVAATAAAWLARFPDCLASFHVGGAMPVSVPWGMCAYVLGNLDEAVTHLEAGVATTRDPELRGQLPFAASYLVAALVERSADGDAEAAQRLIAETREVATEIGADGFLEMLANLETTLTGA